MPKQTFIIPNKWALGDTVCMTALMRDIQLTYPNQYDVVPVGNYSNVLWLNNPYVKKNPPAHGGRIVQLNYQEGIRAAGRGEQVHFLSWFHRSFNEKTGLNVNVTKAGGDLHLTPQELASKPAGRYWVIVAGGKIDMTGKVWSTVYWQETVNILASYGIRCVQAGATFKKHFHPILENVEQYVGKTEQGAKKSERDFFSMIAGADGVICGITGAMHIAAALEKPCVVLGGGREEPWWEGYVDAKTFGSTCRPIKVPHKYLHTVGLLDCGIGNLVKGCWRDRTVPIEQADFVDPKKIAKLCLDPVTIGKQAVPKCMTMITPAHVVEAVMEYYNDGILPPLQRGHNETMYSLPLI